MTGRHDAQLPRAMAEKGIEIFNIKAQPWSPVSYLEAINRLMIDGEGCEFATSFLHTQSPVKMAPKIPIAEQYSEYVLEKEVVIHQPRTRSEMLRQRQALTDRRIFVGVVRLGDHTDPLRPLVSTSPTKSLSYSVVQDVLPCFPNLQVVDMRNLETSSKHLAWIVLYLARVCPLVHSPFLPSRKKGSKQVQNAVFASAPKWLAEGSGGGLRYLRFCMSGYLPDVTSCTEYVDWIVRCCPNIEVIDDAQHFGVYFPFEDGMGPGGRTCLWQIDLDTWTRFCSTCSNLYSFSWLGVPFATRYFEVFGEYAKPKFEELTLGTSLKWGMCPFLKQVNPGTTEALAAGGYAALAQNLGAIFPACPKLRRLTIFPDASIFDDPEARREGRFKKTLNAAVFNEAFWKALVLWCPRLETIEIRQLSCPPPDAVILTDEAVHALATLTKLRSFRMDSVTVSGDALFDLVVHNSATTHDKCVFTIKQRDRPFNSLLETFLTRLVSYPEEELPIQSRDVVLRMENDDDYMGAGPRSESIQTLAQQAHARFPSLWMRGFVRDSSPTISIKKFTFATQPSYTELHEGEEEGEGFEAIDDVFVKLCSGDQERDW